MNDPLDRLRSVLDAVPLSGTADAAVLSRRATVRRCRHAALTGTAAMSAVTLLLTGPAEPHRLGVTTPPPAVGTLQPTESSQPTPDPSASPDAGETPRPEEPEPSGTPWRDEPEPSRTPWPGEPEPSRTAPADPDPSRAESPSESDAFWTAGVGPAPYYAEHHDRRQTTNCATASSQCTESYFDVPFRARDEYFAGLALCATVDDWTLYYSTEQEVELTVTDAQTGLVAYRWSAHESFGVGGRTEVIPAGDCHRYTWRLAMRDDHGRPLVSGREYRITVNSTSMTHSVHDTTFVAP